MHLQEALAVLELTGVERLTPADLPRIARRAQKRWHPDTVTWRRDAAETVRYTRNFQAIESACAVVLNSLKSRPETGARTQGVPPSRAVTEVVRENAPAMRRWIARFWPEMWRQKYRWSTDRVVLAPGRKLREMLEEDFRDDLASLSIISLFYGPWPFYFGAALLYALHPVLGWLGAGVLAAQILACLAGTLPLARYWMSEQVAGVMLWFINVGLHIFHWAQRKALTDPWWAQLMVQIPALITLVIKHVVVRSLFFLVKIAAGEKIIGRVEQDVAYCAGFTDWYVERLLTKPLPEMSEEELFHLSALYGLAEEFARGHADRADPGA